MVVSNITYLVQLSCPKLKADDNPDDYDDNILVYEDQLFEGLEKAALSGGFQLYPCFLLLPNSQRFMPYVRDALGQEMDYLPSKIEELYDIFAMKTPEGEIFKKRLGATSRVEVIANCADAKYNDFLKYVRERHIVQDILL